MIGNNLKLALLEQIEPHDTPVLSLYLDVNRGNDATADKAFALRAAQALRELPLDKQYVARISERLKIEFARPEGRTLALFTGEDPDDTLGAYYLQTELPFLEDSDGALAHWGRPLVGPLLFALDQRERYAVVYVAEARVRVFEAFLGQIQELNDHGLEVDTDEWVPYREARRSPAVGVGGVAARGGADVDSFKTRLAEASARLYRSLTPRLERNLDEERVDRIILMGTPGNLAAFQEVLPDAVKSKVVGTLPPPPNPDADAPEWLPLVQELVADAEEAHELALLDRVREEGVGGLQETLSLLQDHRLHSLVMPWNGLPTVYRVPSGRVSAGPEEARALEPGAEPEEVELLEVLPELVRQSGTALEFVHGPAQERLHAEFGGLAGLTRW